MSYQYSNGLCREALLCFRSNERLEIRLTRAINEMSVLQEGDTSKEIWKEWKELQARYISISEETKTEELEKLAQQLVNLCLDLFEYNCQKISKGKSSERI